MDDVVVVVTGAEPLHDRIVAGLPEQRIIIAADGALDHCLAAGLTVAGLVGDLDSISADGLAWAEQHATIQRHDPDKDHTDTELALAMAVTLDPARLILLSGGGDRIDHTLAAIGALGHPSLTSIPSIEAWWGDQQIRVVHGPGRASIDVEPGATISLLATHGGCSGVTIEGVQWPLLAADVEPLAGHGVSNVATDSRVDIAVSSGVATIFIDTVVATSDGADSPSTPNTSPTNTEPS